MAKKEPAQRRSLSWYLPLLAYWLLVAAITAVAGQRSVITPGATPFDLTESPFISVYGFVLLITGFAAFMGVIAGRQASDMVKSPYPTTRQVVENIYGMLGISVISFLVLGIIILGE